MILTGMKISEEVATGRIRISPFSEKRITTNSYDLTLGESYLTYRDAVLDPRVKPDVEIRTIPSFGLELRPGDFLLGESQERIGSDHYVPKIHAKSGIARLGLFVHITADLIDIGSYGKTTFQIFATLPVVLFPGMLIGQVTFWKPEGRIELYSGKYQGSDGPQPSKTYLDYVKADG
jgi:dCTP deaminase